MTPKKQKKKMHFIGQAQIGTDYQVFKNEKNYLRQTMRTLI